MKTIRTLGTILKILAVSTVLMVLRAQGASATTFDVAAGNGDKNTNSSCSLAEAVHNIVNGNQDFTECPEPLGGEVQTINLPSGTITLSEDLDPITRPVNIIGKGRASSIVDGGGIGNLFRISLRGVGYPNDVVVRGFTAKNVAKQVHNACIGTASDWQSTVRKTVTIEDVDIENCAQYGIALAGFSSTNIVNRVNLRSNDSTDTAGIVAVYPDNVSIDGASVSGFNSAVTHTTGGYSGVTESSFSLKNSTLTGNKLGLFLNATLAYTPPSNTPVASTINAFVANNTIVGNSSPSLGVDDFGSGAVFSAGGDGGYINLDLKNNIIAGNSVEGSLGNCFMGLPDNRQYVQVTSSNNLSDDSCAEKLGSGDFLDVATAASLLGPLQNNGGEVYTMALLDGSMALDQGVNLSLVLTDARGTARPQGTAYDIGAYEKAIVTGTTEVPGEISTPLPPRTGAIIGALVVVIVSMSAAGVLAVEKHKNKGTKRSSVR